MRSGLCFLWNEQMKGSNLLFQVSVKDFYANCVKNLWLFLIIIFFNLLQSFENYTIGRLLIFVIPLNLLKVIFCITYKTSFWYIMWNLCGYRSNFCWLRHTKSLKVQCQDFVAPNCFATSRQAFIGLIYCWQFFFCEKNVVST